MPLASPSCTESGRGRSAGTCASIFRAIVDGKAPAIALLAELAGTLAAETIVRTGKRSYEWRGEAFPRNALRRGLVMVCPHCLLAADIDDADEHPSCAPFMRTVWQLAAVRTCPRHDIALVRAATASSPEAVHDFRASIEPFLARIDAAAKACRPQRPSDLELYLAGRLDCTSRRFWLDELGWHAVAETCQVIGALIAYGRDVRMSQLPEEAWHATGDIGFAVASDGPAGLTALLADLDRSYPRSTKVVRALISHGLLPTFRSVNPINRCPITLVAEDGLTAFRNAFVSLSEASRQRGVQLARLKKQLAAKGVEPALAANIYGATLYRRSDI